MTGAGSGDVAFADESSFATLSSPTWYEPGTDVQVQSASLNRSLERKRRANDPRPSGSRAQNREGALEVSFTMTDTNFHSLIFADSGTKLESTASLAPTATWWISSDVLDGNASTEGRFFQGTAVQSVSWEYQQGSDVRVTLSTIAAQEIGGDDGAAPATPTPNRPSHGEECTFAGTTFKINSADVNKLQSLSLEISNLARFRRGQQQEPVDAVVGPYQPSLSVDAILQGSTQRELAYGTTSATQPQDEVQKQSGTLEFDNTNGNVASYALKDLQANSFDWADLISGDTDITDPTEYQVRTVEA